MGEIVARRRRRLLAGVVLGRFDKDDVQLPSGALGAARVGNARGTASLCCAKRTVLIRAPPRAREIDDVTMLFTCVVSACSLQPNPVSANSQKRGVSNRWTGARGTVSGVTSTTRREQRPRRSSGDMWYSWCAIFVLRFCLFPCVARMRLAVDVSQVRNGR